MNALQNIDVRVTRRFAASSERVFDAWLNPEKARRFLFATESGQMTQVEIDARVGARLLLSTGGTEKRLSIPANIWKSTGPNFWSSPSPWESTLPVKAGK